MDYRGRTSREKSVEESADCIEDDDKDSAEETVLDSQNTLETQDTYQEQYGGSRVNNLVASMSDSNIYEDYQTPDSHIYPERKEQYPEQFSERMKQYQEQYPEQYPERFPEPFPEQYRRLQQPKPQRKKNLLSVLRFMRPSIVNKSNYMKDNLGRFSQTQNMGFRPIARQTSGRGSECWDGRKARKEAQYPTTKLHDGCPNIQSDNSSCDTVPRTKPRPKVSCESCCASAAKNRRDYRLEYPPKSHQECHRESHRKSDRLNCERPSTSKPRKTQNKSSCKACDEPPPKPQCREPQRESFRNSYRESCDKPVSRSRRESRQSDCSLKPPHKPSRNHRSDIYYDPQAGCYCKLPPSSKSRRSASESSNSSNMQGYAPSRRNSDYVEFRDFNPSIQRNPLVINNTVAIPPPSYEAYMEQTSNNDVPHGYGTTSRPSKSSYMVSKKHPLKQDSCECVTSSRAKPKSDYSPTLPRETRQYCANSAPSDYAEHQKDQGIFTRSPLTASSYDVKINPCPKQPKQLDYSNETLNECKVNCQHYCCPSRDPPRGPLRDIPRDTPRNSQRDSSRDSTRNSARDPCLNAPRHPPGYLAPDSPRKCKPCNKPKIKPKKPPSRRSSFSRCDPPSQPPPPKADRNFYVPPSCFAPCSAKGKRTTDTKRGRSCSGFTEKPTTSLHKTRRKIKTQPSIKLINPASYAQLVQKARPLVKRQSSVFTTRLSGCGINNRSRLLRPLSENVTRLGSKMQIGFGYNVSLSKLVPLPTLAKLNVTRRISKLNPFNICNHRCRGGKLTSTSTKVIKSRQRENQRLKSVNSNSTARSTPSRILKSRRDRSQLPTVSQPSTRRDLPQRYQTPTPNFNRSIKVTEEYSRRSPNATSTAHVTRQQSVVQSSKRQLKRVSAQNSIHGNAIKRSVSMRAQDEVRRPPIYADSGLKTGRTLAYKQHQPKSSPSRFQETGRTSAHQGAEHTFPHRVQEEESTPAQSRSSRMQSQSRAATISTRASEEFEVRIENPHYSRTAEDQPEAVNERPNINHQFYRGSFLSINPTMNQFARSAQSSSIPRGSLFQNSMDPQFLKRSIPRGASFIVPNKWQCLGKMNGFIGINPIVDIVQAVPQRNNWNWRKLCPNWLLSGKFKTTKA